MHIQYRARELQREVLPRCCVHTHYYFIFFNVKRVARGRKSVTERLLCLFSAPAMWVFYVRIWTSRESKASGVCIYSLRVGDQLEEKNYIPS